METSRSDGFAVCFAQSPEAWRQWLEENHESAPNVWLVIYKKSSGIPSVYYDDAVNEALCFGWIDSKANTRDEESYYQFFSKRNPKSKWSRVNKLKVEKLISQNKMAAAGLRMVEIAKNTGTWTSLDEVEELIIPADLQEALDEYPHAFTYFEAFPRSVKRGILEWILNAKLPQTRQKRIKQTATLASENIRALFQKPNS